MTTLPAPEARYVPDPRRWRVLAVLMVALFMSLIDVSIVNVALPSIQEGLKASESQLQWVLAGYALTYGVGLVAFGRAGDLYGRGALFMAGAALFTLSSVACGLSGDADLLNISRAVQGFGAGMLSPQAVGMVQEHFRGKERGRAFGYFGAAVGVSVAVGPLLGGLLIHTFGIEHGWRWVFFVNLPVGIIAFFLAFLWFPRPLFSRARGATRSSTWRDLDLGGAALLGLAVLGILLPFVEGRTDAFVWVTLPIGIGLVATWLAWERRVKARGDQPMVDLSIFRVTSFANGTALITVYFVGITSIWVLVALYFQEGLGHTALASGMVGLPSAVVSGVSALWGGRQVARLGRKLVIAGMYLAIVGLASSMLVAWLHSLGLVSEWWLLLTLSFLGSQGIVISPNQALTLADVPLEYAGSSGGIMQTGQRIGTSVGIAVITALAFAVLPHTGWTGAFIAGFVGIIVVICPALVIAYRDMHQRGGRTL